MNVKINFLFLLSIGISVFCSAQYPTVVEDALKQTNTNQTELKKALDYFYSKGDSFEIKSIDFLIGNMPIHNTYSYYWADSTGKRIAYNELAYSTFNDAVFAFDALKKKHGKLHPVSYFYRDIDSLKSEYLIAQVEQACAVWRMKKTKQGNGQIDEKDFLEYVLPYRVDVEEITTWRNIYGEKFRTSFNSDFYEDSIQLRQYINDNFKNLYNIELRSEPLPRLSALQILLRGKGYCEDMADMAVFAARSQGIPATIDNIPAWATSTGKHFTNYMYFDKKHDHFDSALDSIAREPGKVVRTTFSAQQDALASWLDTSEIPNGFLQLKNYKDVTEEYWKTGDFTIGLFPNDAARAVFVGVLNGGSIVPIWFAKKEGTKAAFKNMSRGVVYFPFYFINHRAVPAASPLAFGYKNVTELKPNPLKTHRIVLQEQENYLKYRPGKHYQLLIWDDKWKLLSEQVAPEKCTQLSFDNVPQNALLILRPEYSQGKERPFTILDNGERVWW